MVIIVIGCGCPEIAPLGIIRAKFLITLHYLQFHILVVMQYRPSSTNSALHSATSRSLFIYFYSQNLILKLINEYDMLFLKKKNLISGKNCFGLS